VLFDLLFDAAREAGAGLVAGKCVAACEGRGSKAWITFADGSGDGPFDLVIDACGSRSPLSGPIAPHMPFGALWTTVEDKGGAAAPATLSQRYKRAEQMAGLLPIGGSRVALFWSLRASELEPARTRGIESWRDEWRGLWPEAASYAGQVASWNSFSFASYRHRTLRRPVADRLVHIGDSWHSTSPQLGQGANMALLDAFALAAALRGSDSLSDGLARFVRSRKTHVLLYQWMSRLLTPVYQSGSHAVPYLRDRIVAPLSRLRSLNRLQALMVSGLIGDPLGRLGLEPSRTFTDRSSPR
jgi:2-polyprenyl-6-methoxyphenol hydroxylase-like FAD-dependent oxidoreductase